MNIFVTLKMSHNREIDNEWFTVRHNLLYLEEPLYLDWVSETCVGISCRLAPMCCRCTVPSFLEVEVRVRLDRSLKRDISLTYLHVPVSDKGKDTRPA